MASRTCARSSRHYRSWANMLYRAVLTGPYLDKALDRNLMIAVFPPLSTLSQHQTAVTHSRSTRRCFPALAP